MVKSFLKFFHKEISGLHEAAYLLGIFAIISQLFGLVRDRLLAGYFGAGETLDLYYAAFRIPDIILVSAASVVSISILIPFLVDRLEGDEKEAKRFINGIFTVFFAFIVAVSSVVFFLVPFLIPMLFPGIPEGESREALILLTRVLLLQPILLGVSNLFACITQTFRHVFVYATSPILYNLGIIIGITVFYPLVGISGLALGVVLGALLHLLIQVPIVAEHRLLPVFTSHIRWEDIKKVVLVSLPRTIGLSLHNIAFLVLVSFGSLMGTGSIAIFNLSWNLQSVPLAIVGASYSVAAFPTLARFFSQGNRRAFLDEMNAAIRHVVFWSFPALVLFIVLRAQIVRTLLGFGEFDWTDTRLTAAALALFAISVVAQSLVVLFIRGFYAANDTETPLVINTFSALIIVGAAFGCVAIFDAFPMAQYFIESLLRVDYLEGTSVLMLPLAYSIGLIFAAILFWFKFSKKFEKMGKEVSSTVFHSFSASVIMGFATYVSLKLFDNIFDIETVSGIFLQGLFSGIIGIAVGILVLVILKNKEIVEVWATLHRKIWKAKTIPPDISDDPNL